jgi:predicted DNA-binding transcriptional regulator AlpA
MLQEDRLLRMVDVSERTTVPLETLRYWRARGAGPPSFKIGKNVVYRASDVEAWIDEQRAAAG